MRETHVHLDVAIRQVLVTSQRANELLLEHVPEEIWHAPAFGARSRSVAAIVAHVHNVRGMWITMLGKRRGWTSPDKLDPRTATRDEAVAALRASLDVLLAMVDHGLANGGSLPGFPPDVVHFVAYFVAHEAHHRGQICLAAKLLGHPLPTDVTFGLWNWSKLARAPGAAAAGRPARPRTNPRRRTAAR